jgi:hypothetical protein
VPLSALSAKGWDGKPLVLGHPTRNGRQCSANDPTIQATHAFGTIRDAQIVNGKLACEAWLDEERVKALGAADMLEKLRAGEMVDVSVGAFVTTTDEVGEFNGKRYAAKWARVVPDHLAFLPGSVGACSLTMGCGANRAAEAQEGSKMTWKERKDSLLSALSGFAAELRSAGDVPGHEFHGNQFTEGGGGGGGKSGEGGKSKGSALRESRKLDSKDVEFVSKQASQIDPEDFDIDETTSNEEIDNKADDALDYGSYSVSQAIIDKYGSDQDGYGFTAKGERVYTAVQKQIVKDMKQYRNSAKQMARGLSARTLEQSHDERMDAV